MNLKTFSQRLWKRYVHLVIAGRIVVGLIFAVLVIVDHAHADEAKLSAKAQSALEATLDKVEKAIQSRNYSMLKNESPVSDQEIYWTLCGENKGEHVSFDEAVNRLTALSKGGTIKLNQKIMGPLFVRSALTEGWPGKKSYMVFDFTNVRAYWKWLEVSLCSDYPWSKLDDSYFQIEETLHAQLKGVIESGDFSKLAIFMPSERYYSSGGCLGGDDGWSELSFEDTEDFLLRSSKESKIRVFRDPKIEKSWTGDSIGTLVETKGWDLEYGPFLGFGFYLDMPNNRWLWSGVCDSPIRPSKFGNR